jgi:hypothetical protein
MANGSLSTWSTIASKLLDAWICEGIKIEIEDCADAKEAYDFIKKRYAVTNERARDSLLNQLNELKLEDCRSSYLWQLKRACFSPHELGCRGSEMMVNG